MIRFSQDTICLFQGKGLLRINIMVLINRQNRQDWNVIDHSIYFSKTWFISLTCCLDFLKQALQATYSALFRRQQKRSNMEHKPDRNTGISQRPQVPSSTTIKRAAGTAWTRWTTPPPATASLQHPWTQKGKKRGKATKWYYVTTQNNQQRHKT